MNSAATASAPPDDLQALSDLDSVLIALPGLQAGVPTTAEYRAQLGRRLVVALRGLQPLSDEISEDDLTAWNAFVGSEHPFSDMPRGVQHAVSALHGQLVELWAAANRLPRRSC